MFKRASLAVATIACVGACANPVETWSGGVERTTYEGVFATGAKGGVVQLVSGAPATGTLFVKGGASVPLTGSYNPATGAFAMSGGGYTLSASMEAWQHLTGSLSGTTAATTGVLTAYAADNASPVKVCGTFAGAMSGTLNAVVSGSSISAIAVDAAGNGMSGNGTINGSVVTFEWKPIGTIPAGTTGSATGAMTGATSAAGTWAMSNGMRGTWTAAGC